VGFGVGDALQSGWVALLLCVASPAAAEIFELDLYERGDALVARDTEQDLDRLDVTSTTGLGGVGRAGRSRGLVRAIPGPASGVLFGSAWSCWQRRDAPPRAPRSYAAGRPASRLASTLNMRAAPG
jgi:hypothetical protein